MKISAWCLIIVGHYVISPPSSVSAQPYVDPLQVRYMYGLSNTSKEATLRSHIWIGSDLPIKLSGQTYLLLSPSYEEWHIDSASTDDLLPPLNSFAFPVGLIMPVGQSKWGITVLSIPRWNGEKLWKENTFQLGAAVFVSYARRPTQKFRAGLYINDEFFGLFVVPLFGVDWRLDEKNYLFGMLPGRMTLEHQFSPTLFGGITFRAPTHSFLLADASFVRMDDNQLSAYIDYYFSKHICITMEAGYGLLRQLRFGLDDRNYTKEWDWADGPFVKLNASYRIRLIRDQ